MNRYLVTLLLVSVSLVAGERPIQRMPHRVPGEFIAIVAEHENPNDVAALFTARHAIRVKAVWNGAIKGFSFQAPSQAIESTAALIARAPEIVLIEENGVVFSSSYRDLPTYSPPSTLWGLDMIDQSPPTSLDSKYYFTRLGSGTRIYVVDNGVRADHSEFLNPDGSSRVIDGGNFTGNLVWTYWDGWPATNPCGMSSPPGSLGNGTPRGCRKVDSQTGFLVDDPDCLAGGHGTAVASLAAGASMGVASDASIIAMKFLNCAGEGSVDQLLSALDQIYRTHPSGVGGVVNISSYFFTRDSGDFGGAASCNVLDELGSARSSVKTAVDNLVSHKNVAVVASANNQGIDARCTSPAQVRSAITVGGMEADFTLLREVDNASIFATNTGPAVDLFAPAHNLRAAGIRSSSDVRHTLTFGTSFAAPLVTGCAARYFQGFPSNTVGQLESDLVWLAHNGLLSASPGYSYPSSTTNRLLYCPSWW